MVLGFDMVPALAFSYLLVFARVGSAIMLLPVFGEPTVTPRLRLAIALALTIIVMPIVRDALPEVTGSWPAAMIALIREVLYGVMLGGLVRLLVSAVNVAGTVISMQTGLGLAMSFDPSQGQQSAIFATFLTFLAITLIVVTDLHYPMLAAIIDSYVLFPPGAAPALGDISALATRWMADAFLLGLKMSFPFLAFGLLLYAAVGILSRLMPQLQIFFLVMPVNIFMGFVILSVTLSGIMLLFLTVFETRIADLLAG